VQQKVTITYQLPPPHDFVPLLSIIRPESTLNGINRIPCEFPIRAKVVTCTANLPFRKPRKISEKADIYKPGNCQYKVRQTLFPKFPDHANQPLTEQKLFTFAGSSSGSSPPFQKYREIHRRFYLQSPRLAEDSQFNGNNGQTANQCQTAETKRPPKCLGLLKNRCHFIRPLYNQLSAQRRNEDCHLCFHFFPFSI
jgi:hypothetical protein